MKGEADAAPAPAENKAAIMAQRLAAIAPEDPERRQKAVRIYLESELAHEFGAAVLNDPAFPQMVDAVQQQMQEDAQTAAAVQALGDLLLAGRVGSS
jgi:hypothetical protein